MTRQEKTQVIAELSEKLRSASGFYILNPGPLKAEDTLAFRRRLYEKGLRLLIVKNSLLAKAIEQAGLPNPDKFASVLKEMTGIVFYTGDPKLPAQALEAFRKDTQKEYPILKAAYVEETLFIGEQHLETLTRLKSKHELIAEIIARLQSPMQQVLGALQSAGSTVAGILKTLSERNT